jgi:hypothetical protein
MPENDARGREVRARHDLDQLVDGKLRLLDQRDAGVDDFPKVMRRDVRGHADGDAALAVDEQIGKFRGQNRRLLLAVVVVLLEVDRILVEVFQQRLRHLLQPHLGVAHGRGGIAVDGPEIALPVDQRQAHGKFLRHAHQRIVNRLVAVGVIFTDDVADHARRLAVRLVIFVAVLEHRVEDAAMHRLQAVAHIRQRARHDHAHRVIEIGTAQLVGDRNGLDVRRGRVARFRCLGVGQRPSLGKSVDGKD